MIPQKTLDDIIQTIQAIPELKGCAIGLHGNNQSRSLVDGVCVRDNANSGRMVVIIEEIASSNPLHLKNSLQWADTHGGSQTNATNPTILNKSKLYPEFLGTGLSCGLAIVSAVGVVGGAAAEGFTGGAATALIVVAWAGLVSQSTQCAYGTIRVMEVISNPYGNTLEQMDESYGDIMLIVDTVGIISGVTSVLSVWKMYASISKNVVPSLEQLKLMTKTARADEVKKMINVMSKRSDTKELLTKAAKEIKGKKVMLDHYVTKSASKTMTLSKSEKIVREVNKQIQQKKYFLPKNIKQLGKLPDFVGFSASAMPERWVGNASGIVNRGLNEGASVISKWQAENQLVDSTNWVIHVVDIQNG
jgi:hypothetical protein